MAMQHVEMSDDYRRAADLLDQFRSELENRRAAHRDLVMQLTTGNIDHNRTATATAADAASELLAGRLPGTRSDALREIQDAELSLRHQIDAMAPLEQRLAEAAELARARARRAAIDADPRTVEIQKRWSAARAAVQAALDLEQEQRTELLRGAFGSPDIARPQWLNVEALH